MNNRLPSPRAAPVEPSVVDLITDARYVTRKRQVMLAHVLLAETETIEKTEKTFYETMRKYNERFGGSAIPSSSSSRRNERSTTL